MPSERPDTVPSAPHSDPVDDIGVPGVDDAVRIGEGGFGQVFRGHQPTFSRDVAVKVSRAPLTDRTARMRFERECRAMGRLSTHPNIVTVYESGYTEHDLPYLVMEFAPRGTLHTRLVAEGPLPASEVLSIGVRLAGALETAHRAGILHRDIKPENVLVSGYGEPKLADFGLARLRDAPTTQTQRLTASLLHVPPELLVDNEPTPAADLCSLGSTLFELASGRAPYWREGEESLAPLIVRTMNDPPPDLALEGVPRPLAAVIGRALSRDPGGRPPSARALGEELRAAQRELGLPVTRLVVEDDVAPLAEVDDTGEPPTTDPSATQVVPAAAAYAEPDHALRRHRWGLIVAAAVVLVAALGGAAVALRSASRDGGGDTGGASATVTTVAVATESTQAGPAPSTTLDAGAARLLDFGPGRFDPEQAFCPDAASDYEDYEWQVSVGGFGSQPTGGSVPVGLRNKFGTTPGQELDLEVEVLVLAPDNTVTNTTVPLSGDQSADVLYPDSFAGATTEVPGTYTVHWRAADGSGDIACYGFELV